MKKKSIWRRVNRGFVVSMVLLGAVLLYVLVSQLMLIPERAEIRQLTDDYRVLMESTSMLSDAKIESLKSDVALAAEKKQLKEKLSALFVKDSGYIDNAVELLMSNIQSQTQGSERITLRDAGKETDKSSVISEDVAKYTATYEYVFSGKKMDYATEQIKEYSNEKQRLQVSLNFKQENGVWKIYRISSAYWMMMDQYGYRY